MKQDLTKGWELISVGEAAKELFAGGDVPKDRMSKEWTEEFQIPIYGNGLSESGLYGFTDVPKVDQECITISARGTIGFPIHRTTPFYPIVRLIVLIPKPSLNTKYIFYYLKSVDFINTGTSIPQLTVPQVKQLNIPLAPLAEQHRIVAKLDAVFGHLDSLREKLDRVPELLKNFRQQVLTQAVRGELTRGKTEWRTEKLDSLVIKVGSGATPKGGQTAYKNDGIPFVRSMNIHFGGIKYDGLCYIDDEQAESLKNVEIFENDVLLNITGASIGRVCLAEKEIVGGRVNQHVAIIRTAKEILSAYLNIYLASPLMQDFINRENYGVTRQALTKGQILDFNISLPEMEEQKEIIQRVNTFFELADKIESQYKSLKAKIDNLPQAVLAKAFRGELVGQEMKEYVREEGEVLMAAEEEVKPFEVSKTSKV